MNIRLAARFAFAVLAIMDGIWVASLGIIWATTGVVPATLGPSIIIGGGIFMVVLGVDSALRVDREGHLSASDTEQG